MKIRMGKPQFKADNADLIPANYGMEEHANREIDYIVDSANQKYETALKVDGVEFMLWRKTREGRPCTCKYSVEPQSNIDSRFSEYDEKPRISNKSSSIKVKGSWDRQDTKKNAYGTELGVEIGKIKPDDGSDIQEIKNYPAIDKDEIDAFLKGPLDNRFLYGGESTTACGICFGTGFTNGYSLYQGSRVVFDALNISNRRSFSIDSESRPYRFKAFGEQANQFVEWEWETYSNILDVNAVLLRDNLKPAQDLKMLIKIDDGDFVSLTPSYLKSLKGQSHKVTLRVEPDNPNTTSISFTHIEIIIQFSPWPMTQVNQLTETTSFATPEPIFTMEFPLPPSINKIDEGDALLEMKYQKVFLLSDVTDLQTSKRRLLSWTASGRSMTSFDVLSLLKLSISPNYSVSFSGLKTNTEG